MHGYSIRRLLLVVSIYSTLGQAHATRGCQGTPESKGFDVNIYSYPLFGLSGLSDSFFTTGYSSETLQGTVSGVTDINFSGKSNPLFGNGEIYGFPTTVSHFAMELTGYFLAPQTGYYNFKLAHSDDAASFQIGVKSGLTCCDSDTVDFLISDEMIINRDTDWFGDGLTALLTAESYYPVRIVYYNSFSFATLQLRVIHPDNFEQTTFDNVYQLKLQRRSSPTTMVSTSSMIESSITDSVLSSTTIELPTLSSALSLSSSTAISVKSSLADSSSRMESSLLQNSYTVALEGSSTIPSSYTAGGMSTQSTSTSSTPKLVTDQSTSIESQNSTSMQSFTLSKSKAVSTKCPSTAGFILSSKAASRLSLNTIETQTARQPAVSISVPSISSRGYSLNDQHSSCSVLTQLLMSASQLLESSSGTFGSSEKFSSLPSQVRLSSEVFHRMRSSSLGNVSSLVEPSKTSEPGETPQNSGSSTLLSQVRSLLPKSCSHEPSLSLRTFATSASTIVSGPIESFDNHSSPEKSSSLIDSHYSLKPSISSSLNSTESLDGENTPSETARASSYGTGSNLSSHGSSHYPLSSLASLSSLTPESRPSSVLLLPTATSFRQSSGSTVDSVHSSLSVLSLSKTDSPISESSKKYSLESSSASSALFRLNRSESNYERSSSLSSLASLERVESSNNYGSSANSLNSYEPAGYLNSANSLKSLSSDRLSSQSSLLVPSNALRSSSNIAFLSHLSNNDSSTIYLLYSGSLKPYSTSSSFKYVQTVSSLSYSVSPSVSITVGSAEFSSSGTRFSSLGPSGSLSFETSSNRSRFINSSSSKPWGSRSLSFASSQYSSLPGSLNDSSSVVSQSSESSSSVPRTSSDLSSSVTSSSNSPSGSLYNLSSMDAQLSYSVRSLSSGTSLNLLSSISSSSNKPSGSVSYQSSAISQSGRSFSSSSTSRSFSFETSSNLSSAIISSSIKPSGSLSSLNSASSQYSSLSSSLEYFSSLGLGSSSNFSRYTTFSSDRPSSSLKNVSSTVSQFSSSSSFETFPNLSSTIISSLRRPSDSFGTYRSSSSRSSSNFSSLITSISSISLGPLNNLSFVASQSTMSSSSFVTSRPLGTGTSSNLLRDITANDSRRSSYLGYLSSAASQFSRASQTFDIKTSSKLSGCAISNSAKPAGSLNLSSVASRPSRTSSSLGSETFSNFSSSVSFSSSKPPGSLSILSSAAPQSSDSLGSLSSFRSSSFGASSKISKSVISSSSRPSDAGNKLSLTASESSRYGSLSSGISSSLPSFITSRYSKPSSFSNNLSFAVSQSSRSSSLSSRIPSNVSCSITSRFGRPSGSLTSLSSALSQANRSFSLPSSGKPNSMISLGSSSSLTASITITSKRPTQLSVSPKTSRISRSVSDVSSDRVNQSFRLSSHSTRIWSSSASSLLELKPELRSSKSLDNLSLNSRPEHLSSESGTLQPYFSTSSSELTFSGSSNWGHSSFGVHSQSFPSSKPGSRSLLANSLSASLLAITGPPMRKFSTMPHMPSSLITKAVIQLSVSSKKSTASTKTFGSSTVDSLEAFSPTGVLSFTLATRSGTGLGILSSNSNILRYSDLSSCSLRNQGIHPDSSANINSPASTSYRASSTISGPLTHFPLKSLLGFSKRLDSSPSSNATPSGLSESQIAGSRSAVGKQPQDSKSVQPTSSPFESLSALSTIFTGPGNFRESSPKGTLPTYYSNFSSFSISTIRSWRVSPLSSYTINTCSSQSFSTSIGLSEGSSIGHHSAIAESAASVSTIKSNFVSSRICVVESSALSEGSHSVTKLSTIFPTESLRTSLVAPPNRLTVTLRSGSTEGHSSETFQESASSVRSSSAAQFSVASLLTTMMTSAQIVTSVASPRLSILPSRTLSNSEYAGATNLASGPSLKVERTSRTATDSRGLFEFDFSSFSAIDTLKSGEHTASHDLVYNSLPTSQSYLATESLPKNISSTLNYESLNIRQSKGFTTSLQYLTGWVTSTISTSKSDIGEQHTRQPVGITNEAVRLETDLEIFLVCVALYLVL